MAILETHRQVQVYRHSLRSHISTLHSDVVSAAGRPTINAQRASCSLRRICDVELQALLSLAHFVRHEEKGIRCPRAVG